MCTTAINIATGEEISSIGDLRRIAPIVFCASGVTRDDLDSIPDGNCMCQADVIHTLVFAGFKVWANPDVLPEYLFEPVESVSPQSEAKLQSTPLGRRALMTAIKRRAASSVFSSLENENGDLTRLQPRRSPNSTTSANG